MKKAIYIMLSMLGIITVLGVFTYHGFLSEVNEESDSLITDKNGELY